MDHDDPDRRSSTINKEEGGGGGEFRSGKISKFR